ncbi:hypothetical protein AYI70_g2650 [Smittium culicis]|uniref:Uncharacterized protein n=1 Tax=Smittium culicis TaxID=133412 RepID=A0A1R1Y7A5_9FUNG|nr:hypothetical protein AYI70_g2650 [Smittium culicis]
MSRELYWESPINVDCSAAGSLYPSPNSRTKESITVDSEIMDIDNHPDETYHSEPIVLEEQTDVMERAHIITKESRIGNFHGFQRHSLENSGHLFTVSAKPHRCAEQTDCANRMVSNTGGIQNTEFGLWSTRPRPVCIPPEQEECTGVQLVRVQQPIQLPTMEPDIPSSAESPRRTIKNNSFDTNVEVCHLVSGPIGPINLAAGPSASNDDHTGSKKRKVAAFRKQSLALDDLED